MKIRILDSLSDVDPAQWDDLTINPQGHAHPLLSHAFLHALHETGCASQASGWAPQFITLWEGHTLRAALPLYLKFHSYGEYVFDWSWAEAYHRAGLEYYPKLLCAIPFSPVSGSRLLARNQADRQALIAAALALARDAKVSSLHVLLPNADEQELLVAQGMLPRASVQFHWHNQGYASFDAFLATLTQEKRKKIRQERRKVSAGGVTFRHLRGAEIDDALWQFWTRCYDNTYHDHHSSPYLNLAFFKRLGESMPDNVLLVVGEHDGRPLCASLCIYNQSHLYGRYWGVARHDAGRISGLHFETCYYQPLEFCIAQGIGVFEGGAQGEHKLARGFLPVTCHSAHWIKRPEFAAAIDRFLHRERAGIGNYVDELHEHSPFRQGVAEEAPLAGIFIDDAVKTGAG